MDGFVLDVSAFMPWCCEDEITPASEEMLELAALNFKIDRPPQIVNFPRLHSLAAAHQLTAYDAAYLDLAKRLLLPLATRDDDLRRAALVDGVQIL